MEINAVQQINIILPEHIQNKEWREVIKNTDSVVASTVLLQIINFLDFFNRYYAFSKDYYVSRDGLLRKNDDWKRPKYWN